MKYAFESAVYTHSPLSTSPAQPTRLLRSTPSLILLAIVVANLGNYADTDLWGHVYFGQVIIAHGFHLGRNLFSYSAHGHAWLDHEWLSEVLMAWLYASFGVFLLKVWKFVCAAATILLIAAAEDDTGGWLPLKAFVLIACAFALAPYMQYRPQLFSFVMFAALIAGIIRENRGRPVRWWLAVPGLALWANLHGGFFVGIGTLGLYAVVRGIQDTVSGRGSARALLLGMITVAGALATLATPYGIDNWRTVAAEVGNPLTRQVVADWRPLLSVVASQWDSPHGGVLLLIIGIALPVALAISVAIAPEFDDLAMLAIALVMALAALAAVRNTPFAVIAAAAPLVHHATAAARRLTGRTRYINKVRARLAPPRAGAQAIVVLLALVLTVESGLFSNSIPAAIDYPNGAVGFIKAHKLRGNLLNYFDWGDYLIWHTWPDCKVFIDGRYDLAYPPDVILNYIDFYWARGNASAVLAAYPHDYVLIPSSAPVLPMMLARREWKLLYRDRVSVLFARASNPLAANPAVTGEAKPSYFP